MTTKLPENKYSVIYADPPWYYNDRRNTHTRFCGGAMAHYPTMKTRDIAALHVSSLAQDNCMLFMWATFPNLQDALDVMRAWGFKYKTCAFNWVKTNKKNGKPFFGIGYYTKSNAEVCLLGVKGKPRVVSNHVSQIVMSPRREHSRKPDEVRDKIVQLCGDVPRIELFARQCAYGWDAWGNEVHSWTLIENLAHDIVQSALSLGE